MVLILLRYGYFIGVRYYGRYGHSEPIHRSLPKLHPCSSIFLCQFYCFNSLITGK